MPPIRDIAILIYSRGREAMLAYFTKLLGRYPTWVWTQRDAVPMESGFVNLWHASIPTGTQTIEVEGVCLVFLDPANGRIARNEVYFDRTKLFAK